MGYRHPNPRLVKIYRNYSVEEIARLFGLHKNTVRNWLKQGLPAIDDRRPILILGRELSRFLQERRQKAKQPAGRDGYSASPAARQRSRPEDGGLHPDRPRRATCAASAPTATGSSTGGSISRKSMRFEARSGDHVHAAPLRIEREGHPSVNCDSGKKAQTNENAITPRTSGSSARTSRYLAEAKGFSEVSLDGVAKALNRFETYTKFRDFKAFHIEQAKGFKASLADQ